MTCSLYMASSIPTTLLILKTPVKLEIAHFQDCVLSVTQLQYVLYYRCVRSNHNYLSTVHVWPFHYCDPSERLQNKIHLEGKLRLNSVPVYKLINLNDSPIWIIKNVCPNIVIFFPGKVIIGYRHEIISSWKNKSRSKMSNV